MTKKIIKLNFGRACGVAGVGMFMNGVEKEVDADIADKLLKHTIKSKDSMNIIHTVQKFVEVKASQPAKKVEVKS